MDRKLLKVIYGNKKAKSSECIEHWELSLQPYSFKVVYQPGVTNPADYLSRHLIHTSRRQENMTEECVNFTLKSLPKAMTMEEIVTH